METTFIYALVDPVSEQVRYVGKSNNPSERIKSHVRTAPFDKTHKAYWIRNLIKNGQQPKLMILEQVDITEWEQKEQYYIQSFHQAGCKLTNGNAGGLGEISPTLEVREKLARARYGKITPDIVRNKISMAHEGMKHTQISKQKMSIMKQGTTHSTETKQKMSLSHKGKQHSLAAKNKISLAKKGKVFTDEHRAKLSLAAKNRKTRIVT